MRRYSLGVGAILFAVGAALAADKDTALAAHTRAKKLTAKVTVEFKEEMLSECLKEISRQIEEAGGGSLSAHTILACPRTSGSASRPRIKRSPRCSTGC